MPITVEEKFESRESMTGPNAWIDRVYVIRGTDDDVAAKDALGSAAPTNYDGLVRKSRHVERLAEMLWEGTARYGRSEENPPPPETGDSVFNFDTGGGTQHVTQSLSTVGSYAASGESAPSFGGAIGVTDDAVEGVDITVPVYHFSETHYLAASAVTSGYRANVFWLTGKVNNGSFRGLASGECLFLGANGSQRGVGEDWEITFRFAGSPNKSNLAVGSITGISKLGWEYLWVRYEDVEDQQARALVKRPMAAYVEQVYEYGNFGLLGIGA